MVGGLAGMLHVSYPCPCSRSEPGPSLTRFEFDETHMGSTFHIVLYSADDATARRASRAAFERVAELDATLSDYKPESELMRLCRKAGRPAGPGQRRPVPTSWSSRSGCTSDRAGPST